MVNVATGGRADGVDRASHSAAPAPRTTTVAATTAAIACARWRRGAGREPEHAARHPARPPTYDRLRLRNRRGHRLRDVARRHQTIAAARNRLDEPGIVRGVAEHFGSRRTAAFKPCSKSTKVSPSQTLSQLLPAHHLPRTLEKGLEQLEGLHLQQDPRPSAGQFASIDVELKLAESHTV